MNDIELDVVHGRREPRNVPIMIGATGDQMMEMTGEIADGAILNYCVPSNIMTGRWSCWKTAPGKPGENSTKSTVRS